MNNSTIISIFMPVYNGEMYIKKSIQSVMSQTFTMFELVCVDDSSTDNSYNILLDLAQKDNRIKVYKKNRGGNVPKAWNYILPKLKGQFITYMSQDDYLANDYLEVLYQRHIETNADIVIPNCQLVYPNNQENRTIQYKYPEQIISGKDAFILSLNWQIAGFVLCKKELYKNEIFEEAYFNSDEFMIRKLFFKSNHIAFCNTNFYYNQCNPQSITKVMKPYRLESLYTNNLIFDFIKNNLPEKQILRLWTNKMVDEQWIAFKILNKHKRLWKPIDKMKVKKAIKCSQGKIYKEIRYLTPKRTIKLFILKVFSTIL